MRRWSARCKTSSASPASNLDSQPSRPRSLGLFFFFSAVLSWSVWLWPVHTKGWIHLATLVTGNCLPGVLAIAWAAFEGKRELRRMISALVKWNAPARWYALAVIFPCVIFWLSLDIVLFYFPVSHTFPPTIEFFKSFLMTAPFGPLWEELAWRGWALRKLELRFPPVVAALLLGVYWAIWHIPLWLVTLYLNPRNIVWVLSVASANLVAWSVIFAFLYTRSSQSLPVTILLHTTYVAASSQTGAAVPQFGLDLLYVATGLSVCLAVILGFKLHQVASAVPASYAGG